MQDADFFKMVGYKGMNYSDILDVARRNFEYLCRHRYNPIDNMSPSPPRL